MSTKRKIEVKEELSELLNDCSIDRVLAVNTEMIVIGWNRTSEIISGIKKEDILGKHLFDVLPQMGEHGEIREAIEQAMQGRKTFVPSNIDSPVTKYYENHFIPLKNEIGELMGVMNIMHDVAHRIKVEDQLKKLNSALTKKNEELERLNNELASFTYITGHDLKEPLRHVYTSLEQLIRTEAQNFSHGSRANLRKSQSALTRMSLLVDDILALSQLSGYGKEKQQVDLNIILKSATEILHNKIFERQAVIECTTLPMMLGHDKMLEQFFINVLDNSIKFQEEGNTPKIKIESSQVDKTDEEIVGLQPSYEQYTRICFSDNGIGFPQEDSQRIFLMYERLHPKNVYRGSGMGLAICKKIAEAHDGFMTVKSTPGKGSDFCLYLPVA
jgi:PAS domain S-box-containing protein